SCRVRAPKLTSVPPAKWLRAKGSSAGRPRAMSDQTLELGEVRRVLHAGEQRVAGQPVVPLLQVFLPVGAADKAHVRNGTDPLGGVTEDGVLHRVRPELPGDLELLVDRDRLGDVDIAVCRLGRVVELAERGVTGSGVVPGV